MTINPTKWADPRVAALGRPETPLPIKEGISTMVAHATDNSCPISTPWCNEHDTEESFCLRRVNEFVLTSTNGYRFAEAESEDFPVAVSVRRYGLVGTNSWPNFVEIDLPESTDLDGISWLTAAEARSLAHGLIDAARILEPGCTVLWCSGNCHWDDDDPMAPRMHSRTWPSGVELCQLEYRHPEVDGKVFGKPEIAASGPGLGEPVDTDAWRQFRADLDDALWRADMAAQDQPSGALPATAADLLAVAR